MGLIIDLETLEQLEETAQAELSEILSKPLRSAAWLLEHAQQIVTFLPEGSPTKAVVVQLGLLKQTLNSLRSTSLLLLRGYTSQAATVASGLFEIRLYSSHILNDDSRAKQFMEHTDRKRFVWRPSEMILSQAKRNLEQKGKQVSKEALDSAANGMELSYQFLCGFKHSNPLMLSHSLNAREGILGSIAPKDKYIVKALPDTRPKDNWVKAMVLSSAILSTFLVMLNNGL